MLNHWHGAATAPNVGSMGTVEHRIIPPSTPESRMLDRELYGFSVRPGRHVEAGKGGNSTKSCGNCGGVGRYNVHTETRENGQIKIVVVSKQCGTCSGSGRVPA